MGRFTINDRAWVLLSTVLVAILLVQVLPQVNYNALLDASIQNIFEASNT